MNNFFYREKTQISIIEINLFKAILIYWSPVILILMIGYLNNGEKIFTVQHWIKYHGTKFNPYISILIIITYLIYVSYKSIDIFLSNGDFLSVSDKNLVIYKRVKIPLVELNFEKVHIGGLWSSIVMIPFVDKPDKNIEIPLIMTKKINGVDSENIVEHIVKLTMQL